MSLASLIVGVGFFALAHSAPVASSCDRASLIAAADAYVAAQTAGKLDDLSKLFATNFTYQENNKVSPIDKSVLASPLKLDHRRTIADTTLCATYTEIISATGPKPYVIGTQIRNDPANVSAITMIDTIASTTGSWLFDASKTLQHVLQEDWSTLPENKRVDRTLLQQTADAYLDMWSNATAADAVAWGTPCTRLEGSAYTGTGQPSDSCKPGIPSNHNQAPNTHRRYVIDETLGTCSVLCVWEHMMMAADSHEFRLEGGQLRYVHTMTVCPGQTCRL
jgi:hypothetical protein